MELSFAPREYDFSMVLIPPCPPMPVLDQDQPESKKFKFSKPEHKPPLTSSASWSTADGYHSTSILQEQSQMFSLQDGPGALGQCVLAVLGLSCGLDLPSHEASSVGNACTPATQT
ncbi:hypothetical protein P7K49_027108 [Saguinus oedipus]|uniref:Uncharacterized protein n=1 Tax=Saguinus oedipus TaxID=9490 RepID=A0ABQ9UHE5_SAGOE|nr:hypothetical protein P7K49_027108 [Saguinus oedipus]